MTETTDALELLTSQHDEVMQLFDKIEACDDDEVDEKQELFDELADKLAAHATIEEELFYPSVMNADTCELLIESTEEHLAAKRVLADMLAMDPDDEHWDAKLTVLKEEVRHHAKDQEEGKLFPMLEEALGDDERAALGNELLARFEDLIEGEPRRDVPSQTTEAAHLEAMP